MECNLATEIRPTGGGVLLPRFVGPAIVLRRAVESEQQLARRRGRLLPAFVEYRRRPKEESRWRLEEAAEPTSGIPCITAIVIEFLKGGIDRRRGKRKERLPQAD